MQTGDSAEALIPLDTIIRHKDFQVRKGLDEGTIKRYMEAMKAGSEFPQVKVALIEGSLYLLAGWHRLAALQRLGEVRVRAEAAPMGWDEARWIAADSNRTNGLPLKRSEFRNVFRAYVRAKRHKKSEHRLKSYREIAKEVGLAGAATIYRCMQLDFPKVAQRMGGGEGGDPNAGLQRADHQKQRLRDFKDSMGQGNAIFNTLKERSLRGEAIHHVEEILDRMKKGEYREATMTDFEEF